MYQILKWTFGDDAGQEGPVQLADITDEQAKSYFVSACTFIPYAINEDRISREDQKYFYARYKQVTAGKAGNNSFHFCNIFRFLTSVIEKKLFRFNDCGPSRNQI